MHRVSMKKESGEYLQKDFKNRYAAAQQITLWCMRKPVEGDGLLTFTIEEIS